MQRTILASLQWTHDSANNKRDSDTHIVHLLSYIYIYRHWYERISIICWLYLQGCIKKFVKGGEGKNVPPRPLKCNPEVFQPSLTHSLTHSLSNAAPYVVMIEMIESMLSVRFLFSHVIYFTAKQQVHVHFLPAVVVQVLDIYWWKQVYTKKDLSSNLSDDSVSTMALVMMLYDKTSSFSESLLEIKDRNMKYATNNRTCTDKATAMMNNNGRSAVITCYNN